jgi:hypothetical protein
MERQDMTVLINPKLFSISQCMGMAFDRLGDAATTLQTTG